MPAISGYAKIILMRPTTTRHYILLALILAGFGLRLYRLGAESLWYDETVSAYLAAQSGPDLIGHTARDIHPPGYYLLLHGWAGLAGAGEFALAFFSLIFGLLLIPAIYRLAVDLTHRPALARWAALLATTSPYHLWYTQEVRMYTLGAFLGLAATWCLLRAGRAGRWYWAGYVLCAALGMYTLYYFAFLLVAVNIAVLLARPRRRPGLMAANAAVLLLYLPWLPVAWRQAIEPPVPPWRSPQPLAAILLESWSALAFGQSATPAAIWPWLVFTLLLYILGLIALHRLSRPSAPFLLAYTFGPLLIIILLSSITPLYHVRYLFIYAPAFYIILGAGLAWLAGRFHRGVALGAAALLLGVSGWAIYRFHADPHYRPDDFRSAVQFIDAHWQPGDALMTNAGYVYPAFVYYTRLAGLSRARLAPYPTPTLDEPLLLQTGSVAGSPQLGWGDPRADFYAMDPAETIAALEQMAQDYHRLWLLRAYDTVTDPQGLIRAWLAGHTIPLEDQVFSGESNIRVQGFLLARPLELNGQTVHFAGGLALAGWRLPEQTWRPGQTIPVQLGWLAAAPPQVDYKTSLKLWTPQGHLAAQGRDTWPAGRLYRATAWPLDRVIYQADRLQLPFDLPPGQYWLNVELYHPDTGQPLARLDGADPVVTLGAIVVE